MAPLISVIVPVYKAEDTLRNCVDSILKQTNRDFELLLIDDGSPDSCRDICDTYAAKDARVRVWHKENGGVQNPQRESFSSLVPAAPDTGADQWRVDHG